MDYGLVMTYQNMAIIITYLDSHLILFIFFMGSGTLTDIHFYLKIPSVGRVFENKKQMKTFYP